MDVFRDLMRTRRTPLYPDHVGALNLVEIEFKGDREVQSAFRDLFRHLGSLPTRRPEEEIKEGLTQAQRSEREDGFERRLGVERQALLARLLHAMAKELGFEIEQLEIVEGGYSPQAWANVEQQQEAVRRLLTDIYVGKRGLPVEEFKRPEGDGGGNGSKAE